MTRTQWSRRTGGAASFGGDSPRSNMARIGRIGITLRVLACVSLCVVAPVSHGTSDDSTLFFAGTFEAGDLQGWRVIRVNLPEVQDKKIRSGRYALKSTLKFFNGDGASPTLRERTEVRALAKDTEIGKEYWYGFSIYLPGPGDGADNYVPDKYWEIVTQWFAPADDEAESGRNPPLALKTSQGGIGGRWSINGKFSAKSINSKGDYDGTFVYDLGPYETGKWTDWVFRIKWSYTNDGILEVWKDGKKVVSRLNAPNGFNDLKAPYFKMGIYKGAWENLPEDGSKLDAAKHRVIYHDEFRMADASGSYEAVAPRSGQAAPAPPSALSAK